MFPCLPALSGGVGLAGKTSFWANSGGRGLPRLGILYIY